MSYRFSEISNNYLKSVHNDLKKLCLEVIKISKIDFSIIDSYRSDKRQNELFKKGLSKCDGYEIRSKHQIGKSGFCEAIDFVPYVDGKQCFNNINDYCIIVGYFLSVAKQLNIKINCGALWNNNSVYNNNFQDFGHIEIIVDF